jgi:hypothetical protein
VVGGGIGSILVVLAVMVLWPRMAQLGSLAGLAAAGENGPAPATDKASEKHP